ncbi:organ-specific protein S2-like isoform X3 [Cucurbita moschata]|uniref:Organ-specific protein S2-like isoform X3 n=1 Tax=Cucurbita moschata TaxID=3662 RepID=A0A6J1GJQ3_CUCMO|nr:organ-specific protein S2-like isoform X3 [Cucurbita moschata]
MKGLVFINFFLLILLANTIESRHEPGDHHWRNFIDNKLLHEDIEEFIHSDPNSLLSEKETEDCTETLKIEDGKLFVKNLEPRPQATFDSDVVKTKLFSKDIEPRPNLSFYPDVVKTKLFSKDIEPRPSASFYPDDTKKKFVAEDIEPRPNLSFYPDVVEVELLSKDIQSRPSASFYPDDNKTNPSVKDRDHDNLKAKDSWVDAHHDKADIQVAHA